MGGINFNGDLNGTNKIFGATNPTASSKINNGFNIDFSSTSPIEAAKSETVDAGEYGAMMFQMLGVQPTKFANTDVAMKLNQYGPDAFVVDTLENKAVWS